MNKIKHIFLILFFSHILIGQNVIVGYSRIVKEADSLYSTKEYMKSAQKYTLAFIMNDGKGLVNDRYNAACSWALAGIIDSSFSQLKIIAEKMNYANFEHISSDQDLNLLHEDKRWDEVLAIVKKNKVKSELLYNKDLMNILDSVFETDQNYRQQIKGIETKYGKESSEMKSHLNLIIRTDSLNTKIVSNIIDKYGWLGPETVGGKGSLAIFLVIQHSSLIVQQKYLPLMRKAVIEGKAQASNLVLLEDRVAIGEGRRQIYGTQIGFDSDTKLYYVQPLDDPDNVDLRRAKVGLGSIVDYVKKWNIKWDVECYKKDLPKLEEALNHK